MGGCHFTCPCPKVSKPHTSHAQNESCESKYESPVRTATSEPALLSIPDFFHLGFINPGSFPFTPHQRREENPLLPPTPVHWPTFVPRVGGGTAMQDILLHPEKGSSRTPLYKSMWGSLPWAAGPSEWQLCCGLRWPQEHVV